MSNFPSEIVSSQRIECQDADILAMTGECLEAVRDVDDLNAGSPTHAVFRTVVDRLAALAHHYTGMPEEEAILLRLATSARR
jgi:hypothetical protein